MTHGALWSRQSDKTTVSVKLCLRHKRTDERTHEQTDNRTKDTKGQMPGIEFGAF